MQMLTLSVETLNGMKRKRRRRTSEQQGMTESSDASQTTQEPMRKKLDAAQEALVHDKMQSLVQLVPASRKAAAAQVQITYVHQKFKFRTDSFETHSALEAARRVMGPCFESRLNLGGAWQQDVKLAQGYLRASEQGVVEGVGVVVDVPFLPAKTVFAMPGRIMTEEVAERQPESEKKWHTFMDESRMVLLPDAPWRFLNSACKRGWKLSWNNRHLLVLPTCAMWEFEGNVYVHTMVDLYEGDELLAEYGFVI